MKTADLIDHHASELTFVHLPFRTFGQHSHFAAPIQTVKCFEDNTVVRAQLETRGDGRVLVVDGGGSTRVALLGDMLAELAIRNGWAGLVLNAVIRDSAEVNAMDTLVFALGTSPVKSAKAGWGNVGQPVQFGGVKFAPGDWIYGDADGVLHSTRKLV
ncbi:MAG: ribonuclease E activity regulator RraA [Thalassovita sp.]